MGDFRNPLESLPRRLLVITDVHRGWEVRCHGVSGKEGAVDGTLGRNDTLERACCLTFEAPSNIPTPTQPLTQATQGLAVVGHRAQFCVYQAYLPSSLKRAKPGFHGTLPSPEATVKSCWHHLFLAVGAGTSCFPFPCHLGRTPRDPLCRTLQVCTWDQRREEVGSVSLCNQAFCREPGLLACAPGLSACYLLMVAAVDWGPILI